MPQRQIKLGEKVPLKLTDAERTLLLERVTMLSVFVDPDWN
jgi:hypothetical protein